MYILSNLDIFSEIIFWNPKKGAEIIGGDVNAYS